MGGRCNVAQVALLAATIASSAAAQTGPALPVPSELQGQLEQGDQRTTDNAFFDDYVMHLRAGQRVQLSATSSDFDTVLLVYREGALTEALASDDDSGGGLNSSLTFVPPAEGNYRVRVTSFFDDAMGAYTLQSAFVRESRPLRELPVASPTMAWSTVEGRLTAAPGTSAAQLFDEYRLRLRRGQQAIIQLDSSEFDPLVLLYANGRETEPIASDDDSGEGLNSLLMFRAPLALDPPGTNDYVIRVRSLGGSQAGSYTLRVGR